MRTSSQPSLGSCCQRCGAARLAAPDLGVGGGQDGRLHALQRSTRVPGRQLRRHHRQLVAGGAVLRGVACLQAAPYKLVLLYNTDKSHRQCSPAATRGARPPPLHSSPEVHACTQPRYSADDFYIEARRQFVVSLANNRMPFMTLRKYGGTLQSCGSSACLPAFTSVSRNTLSASTEQLADAGAAGR